MRLAGVEAPAHLVQTVGVVSAAVFLLAWAMDSFATAVLILTSFCCGATVFSLILDICPGNQLPNFLSTLKPPRLHSLSCSLEKDGSEPWKDLNIPLEIDQALSELYEHILREYIYPWYGEISLDEGFVQEIRLGLRYASAVLLKRVGKLDLTTLITRRGIPIGLSHLDSFHHASQYAEAFQSPIVDTYYDFLGKDVHPATHNREKEILHVQNATRKILPFLVQKRTLQSSSTTALLTDVVSGAVLQPVLDLLADPDVINLILEVAFDPEPSKKFPPASGAKVEFLEAFATLSPSVQRPISALQMDLSAVLKDQQALCAFIQFLKEEDAVNQLQFCLSIEDFNKRILSPDLGEDELRALHSEALDLYKLYLKPGASHAVGVSQELAKEIIKILSGPHRKVEKLRTTTPLFRAYEEVFVRLEKRCQVFFKSEQYFEYLLGHRSVSESSGKHRRRSRLRKHLARPRAATPPSGERTGGGQSPSSTLAPITLTPMAYGMMAVPRRTSPFFPPLLPLMREHPAREEENYFSSPPPSPPPRTAQRSFSSPQESQGRVPQRKNSGESSRRSGVKKKLKRSVAETNAKSSDKFGKGLSKLKQGVLGKSMEGVIVDPLDPALDVANFCNDDEKEDDWGALSSANLTDLVTSRDLSSWKVAIPRLSTSQDCNGRPCFVYVIEVTRGGTEGKGLELTGSKTEAEGDEEEQPSWVIHRQFHEFYVLESKLTEFHGDLDGGGGGGGAGSVGGGGGDWPQLPSRPGKLLFGTGGVGGVGGMIGLDVMQDKRAAFEAYLRALLGKPALKGSDILFTFLTSADEFSTASTVLSSGLGLGRMIRSVPARLSKERGQGLVPFISTFVAQTQPGPPKPRHDYVVGAKEFDITLERPIDHHPIFANNLNVPSHQGVAKLGHCHRYFKDLPRRKEDGVFDTVLYLAINIFKVGKGTLQALMGLRILFRRTFDSLVDFAIATKLKEVLTVGRVVYICHLLEEVLFDPPVTRTDDEKEQRRRLALKNLKDFLRPILERGVGKESYEGGVDAVFEALQNPVINKQLAFVLLDAALGEVFPELLDTRSEGPRLT